MSLWYPGGRGGLLGIVIDRSIDRLIDRSLDRFRELINRPTLWKFSGLRPDLSVGYPGGRGGGLKHCEHSP